MKNTLLCIAGQSYSNLEIIISDNASTNADGVQFARTLAERDSRIRVYVQHRNMGPLANFEYTLLQSCGKYFMWAADDDDWESVFIERCVSALEQAGTTAVAATMEARYYTEAGECDFFFEGSAFHKRSGLALRDRLELMLDENYGNLFYSLFRREALFLDGSPVFTALGLKSLNEIPVLLRVAALGDWIVLPEIGMRKRTSHLTYQQARWEKEGGRLPRECRATSLASFQGLYRYHRDALIEIARAIRSIGLPVSDERALLRRAKRNIWTHFMFLVISARPRA